MSSIANAIANAEGYGQPNAIPTLANNPGDLVLGDMGYGTMGNGITVFPSSQSGYDALNNQISLIQSGKSSVYSPNESIAQIGNTWSGGDPNWATNVSSSLGVSPNSSLPANASQSGTPGLWSKITGALGNAAGNAALKAATPSSFNISRVVAIIVGLILIAAGTFGLKGTQSIIIGATGTAAKAAKKAAEVTA